MTLCSSRRLSDTVSSERNVPGFLSDELTDRRLENTNEPTCRLNEWQTFTLTITSGDCLTVKLMKCDMRHGLCFRRPHNHFVIASCFTDVLKVFVSIFYFCLLSVYVCQF